MGIGQSWRVGAGTGSWRIRTCRSLEGEAVYGKGTVGEAVRPANSKKMSALFRRFPRFRPSFRFAPPPKEQAATKSSTSYLPHGGCGGGVEWEENARKTRKLKGLG